MVIALKKLYYAANENVRTNTRCVCKNYCMKSGGNLRASSNFGGTAPLPSCRNTTGFFRKIIAVAMRTFFDILLHCVAAKLP